MILPGHVKKAIKYLENNNYEAYVVGGAVRDYLLGINPSDFDISTNATPIEVKEVFKNFYTIDTGIKHGTISVMIDHNLLEITTYRKEQLYKDYRHPERVEFINNLEEDLIRRDFTINAICYNREIIDLVGGIKDLKANVIKAINDPNERFIEDPLRILRALRFASTLGFSIEENTKQAVIANFHLLEHISKERINQELIKMIYGKWVNNVFSDYHNLLEKYIFKTSINKLNITALNFIDDDLILRLSLIFAGNKDYQEGLKQLKFSNKIIRSVKDVLETFSLEYELEEKNILTALKTYEYNNLISGLKLKMALEKAENNSNKYCHTNNMIILINEINKKYKVLKIKDLNINGKDLLNIGIPEGIEIKKTLEHLLNLVIGGLENKNEYLLDAAINYYFNKKS